MYMHRSFGILSASNLIHNAKVTRYLVGSSVKIIAAVKSNAYGHGIRSVAKILDNASASRCEINATQVAIKSKAAAVIVLKIKKTLKNYINNAYKKSLINNNINYFNGYFLVNQKVNYNINQNLSAPFVLMLKNQIIKFNLKLSNNIWTNIIYNQSINKSDFKCYDEEKIKLIDGFGVSSLDEGLILKKINIKSEILLMQGVLCENDLYISIKNNFMIVFHHFEQIKWLIDLLNANKIDQFSLKIWLKINTGMNRLGFDCKNICQFSNINNANNNINKANNNINNANIYNNIKTYNPDNIISNFNINEVKNLISINSKYLIQYCVSTCGLCAFNILNNLINNNLNISNQNQTQFEQSNSNQKQTITIMSHFASADNKHAKINNEQINNFLQFTNNKDCNKSICNSAGILNFRDTHFTYVRSGLILYGVNLDKKNNINLKPVLKELRSYVISILNIKKGESIGYGQKYIAKKNMKIASIGIGYGDGYKLVQNKGLVSINQEIFKIVGKISMDIITIDITNAKTQIKIGNKAYLINDILSAKFVAKTLKTHAWNLLANIQNRVTYLWE